jgi:hypothetical protein
MSRVSVDDTTISGSLLGMKLPEVTLLGESVTKGMATAGGGAVISVSQHVGAFAEGRLLFIFTESDPTAFASFRGGVRIGG